MLYCNQNSVVSYSVTFYRNLNSIESYSNADVSCLVAIDRNLYVVVSHSVTWYRNLNDIVSYQVNLYRINLTDVVSFPVTINGIQEIVM